MLITRHLYFFLFLPILALGIYGEVQAQAKSNFEGFFADFATGYRNPSSSMNSDLTLNGAVIPSAISSSGISHAVAVLTTGFNFNIAQSYFLGIGVNISPANGLAQQFHIQALNQAVTVSGIKPLYNYGFFFPPVSKPRMAYFI